MSILFKNIKELVQIRDKSISFVAGKDMNILPTLKNAYLIIENELIIDFGVMHDCPNENYTEIIDVSGKMILPSWCDSHTHIVYAENRESEFVDSIKGLSYKEIAEKGGGILNSAKKLQKISEDNLYLQSKSRLKEIMQLGTGAVEIKSGYGLTEASELKMLRVIKKLKENYPIEIKATFLGAHAFPEKYKNNRSGYVQLLIHKIIPKVAKEKLATFIDVFCEKGYFSLQDTKKILDAGITHGLTPKIHVNQFNSFGGVKLGVQKNALSVDHLEVMNNDDFKALKNSKTIPVALPTCSFFLGIPYAPARKIINQGLPLALASDYNPGSTPSGNMNFVVATACIKMKITPEEAINAATINGAYAMDLAHKVGSITRGKIANFMITKPINSYQFIPYAFGNHQIEKVYLKGKEVNE